MNKVKWGVLSTAKIGVEKVIPAMQRGRYCEITAIASRSSSRAKQAAHKLNIPKAYGSYEALLQDPEIDAVYNPLPNQLHVPLSVEALKHGKHVLCEKPISMNLKEAEYFLTESEKYPGLKVMEAFMYRFHPQWQKTRQLVQDGKIGVLCSIQTFFSYYNENPDNIRNKVETGGGALMDIGCYAISLSRFLFQREPHRVLGIVDNDPAFLIDRLTSAVLDFNGKISTFTCGTQLFPYQRVNILGAKGRIEMMIPFNAPVDRVCELWLHSSGSRQIPLPVADQYTLQGDLFSQAVLNDTPVPTPLQDAVDNMRIIEAIFQSVKTNEWISVKE